MTWAYCLNCGAEISDWREGLKGCHRCDEKYYEIEDSDAMEIINQMVYEIDELTEKVQRMEKLEEWVFEHVKRPSCCHYVQVDYQGQLCQSFHDNHYCEVDKCTEFLK